MKITTRKIGHWQIDIYWWWTEIWIGAEINEGFRSLGINIHFIPFLDINIWMRRKHDD